MVYLGLIIAVGIFVGIAFLMTVNQPKSSKKGYKRDNGLSRVEIREKWQNVEETFALGGPSHFKSAIMEADKLADYALMTVGVKGNTMAERLKSAKGKFKKYDDYNNLWYAHKVRNSIAHDLNHDLMAGEAKKAIDYFRKALRELGVL